MVNRSVISAVHFRLRNVRMVKLLKEVLQIVLNKFEATVSILHYNKAA